MEGSVYPADTARWRDIEQVMGDNGGAAGCWCTFWRLTNQGLLTRTADDNRATLQAIVRSNKPAGLLLYAGEEAIGWRSAAPRQAFPRLWHTKGIDLDDPEDASVWSVVFILVRIGHRKSGVAERLLAAAVDYAQAHSASIVEGYPVDDARQGRQSQLSSGTIGLFTRAGFIRRSETVGGRRVVMRRIL